RREADHPVALLEIHRVERHRPRRARAQGQDVAATPEEPLEPRGWLGRHQVLELHGQAGEGDRIREEWRPWDLDEAAETRLGGTRPALVEGDERGGLGDGIALRGRPELGPVALAQQEPALVHDLEAAFVQVTAELRVRGPGRGAGRHLGRPYDVQVL